MAGYRLSSFFRTSWYGISAWVDLPFPDHLFLFRLFFLLVFDFLYCFIDQRSTRGISANTQTASSIQGDKHWHISAQLSVGSSSLQHSNMIYWGQHLTRLNQIKTPYRRTDIAKPISRRLSFLSALVGSVLICSRRLRYDLFSLLLMSCSDRNWAYHRTSIIDILGLYSPTSDRR